MPDVNIPELRRLLEAAGRTDDWELSEAHDASSEWAAQDCLVKEHSLSSYVFENAEPSVAELLYHAARALPSLLDELERARAALTGAEAQFVPEGWVMVPREPLVELLVSMAVREDHGLGVPGHYDQPFYASATGATHAQRMDAALATMRKVYEEVVGDGFYWPERAERYRAMISAAPRSPGGVEASDIDWRRQAKDFVTLGKALAIAPDATPTGDDDGK